MDCKATVNLGESARGGKTRGDNQASDPDMGCKEKYIPCGILDEDTSALHISFGSSYKTSDFIVDTVEQWWKTLSCDQQRETEQIRFKVDNGPESSGVRTQFLNRMVALADTLGKPIHLLYYPPTIASTIQLSGAGASWNNIGMAPSSWMLTRYWRGQRV